MTDPSTRHTLPAQVNALLGREQEVETLRELLDRQRVRMVTITGPGGVGKTSLAVQAARTLSAAFRDGVHFISLAPIGEPTLFLPTLAEYLGVVESPLRLLFDSLKEFLAGRQTLLLLDNFEQIVSAAPMLSEFLGVAPELQLLVTSREALRLRGEREFPLSPLGVAEQPGAGHLSQSPAVALFVERVRAVQPEFQLTEQNAATVAEICTRLDGLPLALELAAARARLLPPEAMLTQLKESSLQLLRRGPRDLPVRQQTLPGPYAGASICWTARSNGRFVGSRSSSAAAPWNRRRQSSALRLRWMSSTRSSARASCARPLPPGCRV